MSPPPENSKPGFSGFRMNTALNRSDLLDEFVVFQGASYFRAKAIGRIWHFGTGFASIPRSHRQMNSRYFVVLASEATAGSSA